ncbi:MAG: glycosyltransferase family 8 protein [Planctomycetia bacterium]|nr:glycosyltransferase family 8 protein [Planctomycetia bacterium]
MKKISIALASDENFVQHMGCLIASILSNSLENEQFYFYVIDGGITEESKEKIRSLRSIRPFEIQFLALDLNRLAGLPLIERFSMNTYSRLLLPELLPETNRILYLDCDMIVLSSLSELWDTDLEGNSLGVVLDFRELFEQEWRNERIRLGVHGPAFNAGMLLLDLKKIREQNLFQKVIFWLKEHQADIVLADQDGLNVIFENDRKMLPLRWNLLVTGFCHYQRKIRHADYLKAARNPAILHYISILKPWHFFHTGGWREPYWHYLRMTPWKDYRVHGTLKDHVRRFLRQSTLNGMFRNWWKTTKTRLFGKKRKKCQVTK